MNPLEKSEFCLGFWIYKINLYPVAKLVQGQPHSSAESYVRLETGLIHGGVSDSLWRKLTTTGSMDEQTCGWVEVKARWTCSTHQVAMQQLDRYWEIARFHPGSIFPLLFITFRSRDGFTPSRFRVSELVPLLHCSSCPLAASQGGHFEAARKELMKMLKVGSTTSGSHKWKNSHMQAKMIHGSYDARSWKSLGGISHKDDKWLLHFSLLLVGLCRTRHCVIDDSCQENPNDPVVLHNLGVALTEEGDGNWQRLLWTKSARSCQPPCLQADTRKLRRNSFKLGSCKRKLARPWLSGDCLMIHGASCLVAAAQVNYATMFGLATVLTEQGAFGGNWIHSKSCLECSCDGPTN